MELTTYLIWALRIAVPIVIFLIYFKSQATKDELYPATKKGHSYSRARLLAHRKAALRADVPEALENITLKDQSQAPALFGAPRGPRVGPGGRREERRDRREPREAREPREPRDVRDPQEGREPRESQSDKLDNSVEPLGVPTAPQPSPSEEKMHLESLLNYVAFNRKEQQRTFLLDAEAAPPPPPRPRRPRPEVDTAPAVPGAAAALPVATASSPRAPDGAGQTGRSSPTEQANEEAQMVLRGAMNFKRADVARDLYEQLAASQVEVSEQTFALMIEACVQAKDLRSASDLLMKMEAAGHSPETELLDKVMDLHSQQKSQREHEKQAWALASPELPQGVMASPLGMVQGLMNCITPMAGEALDGPRAKLSRDAPIFVPSFGIPPPPPKPEPTLLGHTSDAAVPLQRTKLTAAAKPFEPHFNAACDPFTITWSGDVMEPDQGECEGHGQGKVSKSWGKARRGRSEAVSEVQTRAKQPKAQTEGGPEERGHERGHELGQEQGQEQVKVKKDGKKPTRAWKPKADTE